MLLKTYTIYKNIVQSPKNYENDIAIWELSEPLEMNDYVAAVGLPEMMQPSDGQCTVSGWGTLSSGTNSFLDKLYILVILGGSCCPMKLMRVDVPVVPDGRCR